jgi:hypothetical protein
MKKLVNFSFGITLAAISCGILIYAFETDRSFTQILITFSILFLPITFISSIKGKVIIFLFASLVIIGGYICIKQQWYDTGFGVALGLLLGGATYLFRVSKANTFNSADYKKIQKQKRNGQ